MKYFEYFINKSRCSIGELNKNNSVIKEYFDILSNRVFIAYPDFPGDDEETSYWGMWVCDETKESAEEKALNTIIDFLKDTHKNVEIKTAEVSLATKAYANMLKELRTIHVSTNMENNKDNE